MKRNLLASVLSLSLTLLSAGAALAAPHWPTVAEQLQRDHVKAGSALEKLIRGNQDFRLLRADEAGDDRGIPPWLRVVWRKAHPELNYSASDPTGGYPLILHEIYSWMISHPDLVPGSPQEDAVLEKSATPGTNLRVSGLQTAPRSESDIRINFWNPNKVIAASNDIETSGIQAQFYSTDGGATWGQSQLSLVNSALFNGDPAVDWTSDGTAWATTLGINSLTNIQVQAFKSTNGGVTWTFDGVVSASQTTPDKEMLWADHSATSPYKDNLYTVWQYQSHVNFNRRTGPTGSWGTPFTVTANTSSSSFSALAGADVKTNAYGDVFVFWPGTDSGVSTPPNRIFVNKSTDGGQTFPNGITVAPTYALYQYSIPAQANRKVLIYVSSGAYRTASKNLVYATWNDLTGVAGCASNSDAPGTNTASTCKSRIWFARSTDGGATWATPVMINNQSSLNDQFYPHLAVDETSGAVSITYYDTVADTGRHKTDVWYQSSSDNGVTWSGAVKVSTAQTDETVTGADSGNQYGDYTGLSGYAGVFLPSWTDRRNNAKEEIWTAQVQDNDHPPTASFTYNCTGLSCTFNASGSTDDFGIVSYAWTFGDSSTGSGVSPTHAYAASGSYPVTLTVTDTGGNTGSVTQNAILVFADVPPGYWARSFIEGIYFYGVTGGCAVNPRRYCPDVNINRADTAVFLLASKGGPTYAPPACTTPTFTDVPCSNYAAAWVDEFARRGITAGCGGGNYCPNDSVTRATMSYYLLATLGIPAPTSCTGRFTDVPCTAWYAPWVEELVRRGITSGCSPTTFCPNDPVTRAQMAVFLVQTFGIPH
jgi:PKD repeat protein